jgi:hypothetical protein
LPPLVYTVFDMFSAWQWERKTVKDSHCCHSELDSESQIAGQEIAGLARNDITELAARQNSGSVLPLNRWQASGSITAGQEIAGLARNDKTEALERHAMMFAPRRGEVLAHG